MKRSYISFFLALLFAQSSYVSAADPAWWAARGVVNSSPASNKSPATCGQVKHMIAMALLELKPRLDDPSYQALRAEVNLVVNIELPSAGALKEKEQLRAGLLIGQLKASADPFYRCLNAIAPLWLAQQRTANGTQDLANPTFLFPWSASASDDSNKALAVIGQLKSIFAFRFEVDTDANSLPDFWEYRFMGRLGNNPTSDLDGDGISNFQESQANINPLSYDSDQDGMPDLWEISYQLNPNDFLDGVLDSDSDGASNIEEFQAATNPKIANQHSQGPSNESFVYDQSDRLNRVISPVTTTLTLDQEGNILTQQ